MVFTSPVFLGLFLPALFAVYFLANHAARTYVLLAYAMAMTSGYSPFIYFRF